MSANAEDFSKVSFPDNGLSVSDHGGQKRPLPEETVHEQTSIASSPCLDVPTLHPCKKIKKKHMDPSVLKFRCCVQNCCKNNDLLSAMDAYEMAIKNQTKVEAQTFYSLLSLCDGLNDRGIHVGTPKTSDCLVPKQASPLPTIVDDVSRRCFAERLKQHMDNLKLPLTENAYTALVRIFCRTKDFQNAECTLTEAETTQQCKAKLRLYSPLLVAYCDDGQLLEAVRVWHRLSKVGLILSETEYCSLIRCCCQSGNVFLFQRVLSDLSEDILVPSHETTRCIVQWFKSSYTALPSCPNHVMDELETFLSDIRAPYEDPSTFMGNNSFSKTSRTWILSHHCQIEPNSGKLLSGCLQGAVLQPVSLSTKAWNEMKQMNERIAVTGKVSDDVMTCYQGGGKGRKMIIDSHALLQRQVHWNAFQEFLRKLDRPADVLIDGANVGFYEQNFIGAPKHVDYNQIDWVVQHFIHQKNQAVLLVMHSRHFAANLMPPYAKPILQKWIDCGVLYQTPPGMNDDWFWLHAALHFGPGTLVVTNDEMRDHHFQMVAPRSFLRWRDRHQIHFSFGGWVNDDDCKGQLLAQHREVVLTYPDTYSRRIQRVLDGLVIPLPKRGDKNRFLDGVFVADDEPEEEMYLSIRPKDQPDINEKI